MEWNICNSSGNLHTHTHTHTYIYELVLVRQQKKLLALRRRSQEPAIWWTWIKTYGCKASKRAIMPSLELTQSVVLLQVCERQRQHSNPIPESDCTHMNSSIHLYLHVIQYSPHRSHLASNRSRAPWQRGCVLVGYSRRRVSRMYLPVTLVSSRRDKNDQRQ